VTLILEVFSSMTAFELLKGLMGMVGTGVSSSSLDVVADCVKVFYLVNEFVTAGVSINRINNFLHSVSCALHEEE
jgi:hypothetical protein